MRAKLKPLPESVEVNHHSIVIRVYRHGDAGQWFTTVTKDCFQLYRSEDCDSKGCSMQLALTWLEQSET